MRHPIPITANAPAHSQFLPTQNDPARITATGPYQKNHAAREPVRSRGFFESRLQQSAIRLFPFLDHVLHIRSMSRIGEQRLFQVAGRDRSPHRQRKKIDGFFGSRAEQVSAEDSVAPLFHQYLESGGLLPNPSRGIPSAHLNMTRAK